MKALEMSLQILWGNMGTELTFKCKTRIRALLLQRLCLLCFPLFVSITEVKVKFLNTEGSMRAVRQGQSYLGLCKLERWERAMRKECRGLV